MGSNYLQFHVMYLLADDSVPAAACEHLHPEQETPVPHGAAPATAGRDTAQSYGRGKNIFLWFPAEVTSIVKHSANQRGLRIY